MVPDFEVPKQFQQSHINGRHLALIEDIQSWASGNVGKKTTWFRKGGRSRLNEDVVWKQWRTPWRLTIPSAETPRASFPRAPTNVSITTRNHVGSYSLGSRMCRPGAKLGSLNWSDKTRQWILPGNQNFRFFKSERMIQWCRAICNRWLKAQGSFGAHGCNTVKLKLHFHDSNRTKEIIKKYI